MFHRDKPMAWILPEISDVGGSQFIPPARGTAFSRNRFLHFSRTVFQVAFYFLCIYLFCYWGHEEIGENCPSSLQPKKFQVRSKYIIPLYLMETHAVLPAAVPSDAFYLLTHLLYELGPQKPELKQSGRFD